MIDLGNYGGSLMVVDRKDAPASARLRLGDRAPADIVRVLDVIISALALVALAPLMLAVALAIKLQDGGPALFGHKRVGLGGQTFRCWKFRSMAVDSDRRLAELLAKSPEARAEWEETQKLRADPRVTHFGRFLRKSSLDELPQLFNTLVGEMALVGPRPIVQAEAIRYGRWFRVYCSVRPGITGLWQISGRSNVSYRRRVAADVTYIRARSVALDLKILVATIPAVVLKRGSY
jgi:lipopolysaccharide/colanic/teichoic acid biosynthesis glycosyltransferase